MPTEIKCYVLTWSNRWSFKDQMLQTFSVSFSDWKLNKARHSWGGCHHRTVSYWSPSIFHWICWHYESEAGSLTVRQYQRFSSSCFPKTPHHWRQHCLLSLHFRVGETKIEDVFFPPFPFEFFVNVFSFVPCQLQPALRSALISHPWASWHLFHKHLTFENGLSVWVLCFHTVYTHAHTHFCLLQLHIRSINQMFRVLLREKKIWKSETKILYLLVSWWRHLVLHEFNGIRLHRCTC